ncbi:hypothetical protein [Arthrobacter sp. AK04]|uniref:hypothetical protein n=1 Tax=Arthrobacter sp. AK04 TaxID=2900048 RepID=UPI001E405733|nr:hypothetical protein [Arthrobacter sp. AK04]
MPTDLHGVVDGAVHGAVEVFTDLRCFVSGDLKDVGASIFSVMAFLCASCGSPDGGRSDWGSGGD